MYTDWLLIRRVALELDLQLRGARVRDVGQLPDGRLALQLWQRGDSRLFCVDAFAPTPLVTLEQGTLPIAAEPGFVRALGAALRGMAVARVRSRRGDRVLRIEFAVRSRFGVESGYHLICELVPRFGNVVLVKGETVVAAAKEFSAAENARRPIVAGMPYVLPPLDPSRLVPRMLAEQYGPQEAAAIVERLGAPHAPLEPLYVYRREGQLVQAHLVPLPGLAGLPCERVADALSIFAQARESLAGAGRSDRQAKRRRDVAKALGERETRIRTELAQIEARLRDATLRAGLRETGEAIYASLYELPDAERANAKHRAAQAFAAYKKLGAALEHIAKRRDDLRETLEAIAALQWELERAGETDLDDVVQAAGALDPQRRTERARTQGRKRKPLHYVTAGGSRIFVGRSPLENADLTFRVARPDDLWFHVRNQPGAHVILQRDGRGEIPAADIESAASLAAFHSKARTSPKVTVDYTLRKHVRKRSSSAPGLVFYTHAHSLYVEPREPD